MAEPVAHNEPAAAPPPAMPDKPKAPQGAVTPQGTLAVYEPGSGKLLGEVRVASAQQVRDTVAAARAAQAEWARKSFAERRDVLLRFKGLPRGVFGVVQGKGDAGAELIRSGVNMIIFTGSVATGKKVNVAAAEQMIPCVLELGGKDPAIVLPDADVPSAAQKIAWGAFANSGQTCASVERVYVHESIAKPFTEKVAELARKLRQGEPNQHDVEVGAMTTLMQVEIIKRHLDDARQRGATITTGGEITVTPEGARFVQP